MFRNIVLIALFLTAVTIQSVKAADTIGSTASGICFNMGGDHVAASQCLGFVLSDYEKKLADLENKTLESAQAFDAEFKPKDLLAQQQEASAKMFKSYMETECSKILIAYLGGNGAGDAYAVCKINFMVQRIQHLNDGRSME